MSDFQTAVAYVLLNEKGLEENAKDPGGITNFGISLRFLKSLSADKLKNYGIFDQPSEHSIRNLTLDLARKIYHGEFWQHAPFDMLRDQDICDYVFDMAVNMGIAPAIKCLQRSCWSAYKNKALLKDDGILGGQTIHFVNAIHSDFIFPSLRSERAGDYRIIVATHEDQRIFLGGWLARSYNGQGIFYD